MNLPSQAICNGSNPKSSHTSILTNQGSSALSPDLAPCPDCAHELLDPANRRFRYPFIACARCGPRYTVTSALPYDRERTSLVEFPLCPECLKVLRVMAGRPRMIRRARGHAPAPVDLPMPATAPGMAMGGHMKNTVTMIRGRQLVLSPHLGDMDAVSTRERHAATRAALESLLRLTPKWVACDMHPDYATTVLARQSPLPRLEVQHHHAHLLAVSRNKCGHLRMPCSASSGTAPVSAPTVRSGAVSFFAGCWLHPIRF